jgi:DNA repair exonuclease SbcCD nuclease subunit
MFDAIYDRIMSHPNPQKIFVAAGDIYDRKTITEEERNLFLDFLTRLLLAGVHVVVINGNHDFYVEGLTLLEPLRYIARLNKNLHVVLGDPGRVDVLGIGFGCVPCQQDLNTERITAIAKRLYQSKPCDTFYMVVHEAVLGSTNHRGTWKAKSDKYLRIPKLDFVTGWMLGDIHKRQKIAENAFYAGSPIQVKSDEDPNGGILEWRGPFVKFHQIKSRGFRFTADYDEALELSKEGHYVRFTGQVPKNAEVPSNVAVNGDISAIEIDIDFAGTDMSVDEFKFEMDLITPLPTYLASQGLQPHQQKIAVELVSGYLQSRNNVAETVAVGDDDDYED